MNFFSPCTCIHLASPFLPAPGSFLFLSFLSFPPFAFVFDFIFSVTFISYSTSCVSHYAQCEITEFFTVNCLMFQGAMMSIAFKEGLKIAPQAMDQIIIGANQDVRQVGR